MGSDNGTKQASSSRELAHPRLFQALVVLHFALACAGFLPAVKAFHKRGKWYVNPVLQPEEWASENHATMKAHAVISLAWIAVAFLQYVLTPHFMTAKDQTRKTAKTIHRAIGYVASALLVAFAINANYLTWKNGVAGLVLYNFLALITGTMMLWHLVRALRFIRQKQVRDHISQAFVYDEHCDTMNTSGLILGSLPINALGLMALRWAATGEKFRHADYANFYVLCAVDVLIGWLGSTLFQCHPGPQGALLEQVPGQAWVLKRFQNETILGAPIGEDHTRLGGDIFEAAWMVSH